MLHRNILFCLCLEKSLTKGVRLVPFTVTFILLTFVSHWSITEETKLKVNRNRMYLIINLLFVSYCKTHIYNVNGVMRISGNSKATLSDNGM